MFSNKQIVCIEYMEITEDDEREIFRVRGVIPITFFDRPILFKIASITRYGPQLRREDESGSADPTTNAHPRSRPRIFHAPTYPRIQRPMRRRFPLDRTVATDDPRPTSHHQTHDRDDRATDHMAQRYRAARSSVEEARAALIQAARRHTLRISGMPQSVARTRDDRADRPRNDGPARL